MKTTLIDKGNLSSQLTIVIEPDDYQSEYSKELRKYSQKAQIKGFRKGKVPLSAIKKMYGKSVMAEVINTKLQNSLEKYLVDEKLDILGGPVTSEDQPMVDFDLKDMGFYEFKFDLGISPKIEVSGTESSDHYSNYKILIDEKEIDDQLVDLQKRMGEQQDVELPAEATDILTISIAEKNSDGDPPFTSDITIMPNRMTDPYRDEYLGKSKGYKSEIDIYAFEKDASEDHVRKYFLKEAPETVGAQFITEIKNVKRLIPAEMNEEFFKKAFGEESNITEESSARERLREDLAKFYESQGLSITKRYILEKLIESNEMELPDTFLKRWLLVTNEKLSPEQLEQEYGDFVKNLKWTLIKKELSSKYNISIEREQIKESMIQKFKSQFAQYGYGAGMGDLDYDGMGEKMMQNQESVQKEYEELLAESVLEHVLKEVTLDDKEISTDEYKSIVEELRQNNG